MLPNKESLKTITQLETLVLIDKSENKLKDIAQLFVNAFRDWDTFNQTELLDFIKELLDFFGSPLTKEKIAGKQFDINKAWRHEAGNSIIEMIDISERFCNETDFQKIVETILTHYEKQLQNIDFIANLKYLTTEEGGRKTPVFATGYRPQIKFDFDEMQTSGQQTFLNKDVVYPGETVVASLRIIAVEHFSNRLTEGMPFEFREGSRIIGTGKITDILNNKLKKASR